MPRTCREPSKTGVYHAMVRGNERKKIFMSDEDRERFVSILREKSRQKEFSILAYCLMDNHIHLLLQEGKDQLNRIMKRISVSYVFYFNKKYKRTGHLFQDRFKSEPVEDERYLLSAVRYIHNNPVKAKLVEDPAQYRWSSYGEYINSDDAGDGLINRDFILTMFSVDKAKAIKMFIEFSKEVSNDRFIDIEEKTGQEKTIQTEAEVWAFIEDFLIQKGQSGLDKEWRENKRLRNELIRDLKANSVLTIMEIAKILGFDRNIVQRA